MTDIAVICYDISSLSSFQGVSSWYGEIKKERGGGIMPKIMLIGCKTDLEAIRQVNRRSVRSLCERIGAEHFECSAKFGTGIRNICGRIGYLSLQEGIKKVNERRRRYGDRISLKDLNDDDNDNAPKNGKSRKCCGGGFGWRKWSWFGSESYENSTFTIGPIDEEEKDVVHQQQVSLEEKKKKKSRKSIFASISGESNFNDEMCAFHKNLGSMIPDLEDDDDDLKKEEVEGEEEE